MGRRLWGFILLSMLVAGAEAFAAECAHYMASEQTTQVAPTQEVDPLQAQLHADRERASALILQYHLLLGFDADPFLDPTRNANPDETAQLFERLGMRIDGPRREPSPMLKINEQWMRSYVEKATYDEELVNFILEDSDRHLVDSPLPMEELQGNLLALQFVVYYIDRYRAPDLPEVDRDGEREKKQERQEEEDQDDDGDEEELDEDPDYPDLPEDYDPHTKETEQKGKKKRKQRIVAEVDVVTWYFSFSFMHDIVRGEAPAFRKMAFLSALPNPGPHRDGGQTLRIFPGKRTEVIPYIPSGFKPLQPRDPRARLTRRPYGNYSLKLDEELASVEMAIVPDTNIRLSPMDLQALSRPIGFGVDEWPDEVRKKILNQFAPGDGRTRPLDVAKAIEQHIAKGYLYSVGPRDPKDPIDALKDGAFQCDVAAYIMIALLRDVYGIPSRVVGGFRSLQRRSGVEGKSYVIVPSEAHAWIEVFHSGEWHRFDPTPETKDKKTKDKMEEQEFVLRPAPEVKPEDEDQDSDQPGSGQGQGEGKGKGSELDEIFDQVKKDTKNRVEKIQKEKPEEAGEGEGEGEGPDAAAQHAALEELLNQLDTGSLSLENKDHINPLLGRAIRARLSIALEPGRRGGETLSDIMILAKQFQRRMRSGILNELIEEAKLAHRSDHPGLEGWIQEILSKASRAKINDTYHAILSVVKALEIYTKTLDESEKQYAPLQVISRLRQVLKLLEPLGHANAQDISLVDELIRPLASVARVALNKKHDLSTVGANEETYRIAKLLKSNDFKDWRLLSALAPMTDFILNSTPRPEYAPLMTWHRDRRRVVGRELMPVERMSEMRKALRGQPDQSLIQNFLDGTLFFPTRRQRVWVPNGTGQDEAERITILLYDTSGSMGGDPARFLAALIAAFVDQALSDMSPSGKHRHRMVIVPFDDGVGAPVHVTNLADAVDLVLNYQARFKNTSGGTDIQKALLAAFAIIADAQERTGEPLAAANIILKTDGQATLDLPQLREARGAIDRNTPIQTMFVAVNQTSDELARFAMDSESFGSERGFYREFSSETISKILQAADNIDLGRGYSYFSEEGGENFPPQAERVLTQALHESREFLSHMFHRRSVPSREEQVRSLEPIPFPKVKELERAIERHIDQVRQAMETNTFSSPPIRTRVTHDLIRNFERVMGIDFRSLTQNELEKLRHLAKWTNGYDTK